MAKLIIEMNKDIVFAKEILKGWQYMVYKNRLNALYKLIIKRMGKYKYSLVDGKDVFMEEGEPEYIKLQKKRLEAFLFGDSKELNKHEYKGITNDRLIQKVARGVHKVKDKIKDKAIRSALLGNDVMSFFAKVGIGIKWRIE